ncbi:hypothetical protein EAN04_24595 [Salmonella enterica]|nr:hypothetical protein [Salmonella enterica]
MFEFQYSQASLAVTFNIQEGRALKKAAEASRVPVEDYARAVLLDAADRKNIVPVLPDATARKLSDIEAQLAYLVDQSKLATPVAAPASVMVMEPKREARLKQLESAVFTLGEIRRAANAHPVQKKRAQLFAAGINDLLDALAQPPEYDDTPVTLPEQPVTAPAPAGNDGLVDLMQSGLEALASLTDDKKHGHQSLEERFLGLQRSIHIVLESSRRYDPSKSDFGLNHDEIVTSVFRSFGDVVSFPDGHPLKDANLQHEEVTTAAPLPEEEPQPQPEPEQAYVPEEEQQESDDEQFEMTPASEELQAFFNGVYNAFPNDHDLEILVDHVINQQKIDLFFPGIGIAVVFASRLADLNRYERDYAKMCITRALASTGQHIMLLLPTADDIPAAIDKVKEAWRRKM